ncbi:MAG: hypothetical protein ACSW8C_01385 [bacterium]
MASKKLCITLRPLIYKWIVARAQNRQVSISRCIEDVLENQMEEDSIVTEEDLEKLWAEVNENVQA